MDGYHYTLVAYFSNTATKYSGVPDYPDLDDQPPHWSWGKCDTGGEGKRLFE